MDFEFKPYGKTPRLDTFECVITEKLDGTNSCVVVQDGEVVGCQSRNRIITVDDDNFTFARWVEENKEELSKLGDGYHYGEWVGPGIQKNPMGLEQKEFYLFNTFRPADTLPSCVKQVPVLWEGSFSNKALDDIMTLLPNARDYRPEGIIIYFKKLRQVMKFTYEGPKWKTYIDLRTTLLETD